MMKRLVLIICLLWQATAAHAQLTLTGAGGKGGGGSTPVAYVPAAVHLNAATQLATTTPIAPADSCNYVYSFWKRTNWFQGGAVHNYESDGFAYGPVETLPMSSESPRGIETATDNAFGGSWRFSVGGVNVETAANNWSSGAATLPFATGLPSIFNYTNPNVTIIEDHTLFPSGSPQFNQLGFVASPGYNPVTGSVTLAAGAKSGSSGSSDTMYVDNYVSQFNGPLSRPANVPYAGVWVLFIYTANVCTTRHQYEVMEFVQNQNGNVVTVKPVVGDGGQPWGPSTIAFNTGSQGFTINPWAPGAGGGPHGDYADLMMWTGCDVLNSTHNGISSTVLNYFVNTTTGAPVDPKSTIANMTAPGGPCYNGGSPIQPVLKLQGPASNWTTNQGTTSLSWTVTSTFGFPITDLVDSPAGVPAHKIALKWACSTWGGSVGSDETSACGDQILANELLIVDWNGAGTNVTASDSCTIAPSTVAGSTGTATASSISGSNDSLTVSLNAPTTGPSAMAGQWAGWGVTLSGFSPSSINGTYKTQAGSNATTIVIPNNTTVTTRGTVAWATGNALSTSPIVPWLNNVNASGASPAIACAGYKWADSSDASIATSYTATSGINGNYSETYATKPNQTLARMVLDYGLSMGSPISIDAGGASIASTASTSLVAPPISPSNSGGNDTLVNLTTPAFVYYGPYTCPAGSTVRAIALNNTSVYSTTNAQVIVCDEVITASGSTGTRTVTQLGTLNSKNTAGSYNAALIALKPN